MSPIISLIIEAKKKKINTYINKQGQQAHYMLQKIYAGMEQNHGIHHTSAMQIYVLIIQIYIYIFIINNQLNDKAYFLIYLL